LITREDNRDLYAERMAQEIAKMERITSEQRELEIHKNEFLVLESLLMSPDYFIDMVPSETNECLQIVPTTHLWRFMAGSNRLEFKATPECSFAPLVYMLQEIKNQLYQLPTIKKMLWKAYNALFDNDREKIQSMINRQVDAEELIMSEAYYMMPQDMLVFAEAYKLPVIMFSSEDHSWNVLGGDRGDKFFFYESVSGYHGWPNNVLIDRTFGLSEMNKEFEEGFERKRLSVV